MSSFIRQQILMFVLMFFTGSVLAAGISGAGATFPASIYKKWGDSYKTQTGTDLNYQAVGSGEGIKQILDKSVDFGASDKPLKPEDLEKAGMLQFPTVVGGVVPVINVAGIEHNKLKLDGPVLASIYLGKITRWNDPTIAALNPDIKLPNESIEVIHRSDSSGTTFIFTNYLSKVSAEWKSAMGEGTSVSWKVGTGCRSNILMPICMNRVNNSIGYMDYAYAAKNRMSFVQMKNHAGQFIMPGQASFMAAAAHAHWEQSPGFYEIVTDEPGFTSWPIAGATFILMHKQQEKPETSKEVLRFFNWAYTQGGAMASELGYVPLPEKVQQLVREAWIAQIKNPGGKVVCLDGCAIGKIAQAN